MNFVTKISAFTSITVLSLVANTAMAADPLANTRWKTIDDETNKPKGIIKITEENGKLVGRVQEVLVKDNLPVCTTCKGKYANKSIVGAVIFYNLAPKGDNTYVNGKIYDPKSDKTYDLKATLKGNTLEIRGYKKFALLGRTQKWQKVN